MVEIRGVLRKGLLAYRIVVVVAVLLSAAIVLSGAYSAFLLLSDDDGDSGFEDDGPPLIIFPDEDEITTTLVGDRITITAPLGFKNSGFLPVEDLVINMSVDYGGKRMLEGKNVIGSIPGGDSKSQAITFSGSLRELFDVGLGEVLFNDVETSMKVGIAAGYVYGMFSISLELTFDMPWSAPVNISMDMEEAQTSINDDATASISFPVVIRTAEWFSGHVDTVLNISAPSLFPAPLGQVVFSSPLGGDMVEYVNITLSIPELNSIMTQDTTFIFQGDVVLTVGGVEREYALSKSVVWKAPLGDVDIHVDRVSQDSIMATATFSNLMEEGMSYTVDFYFFSGENMVVEHGQVEFLNPYQPFHFQREIGGVSSVDRYVCVIGWEHAGPLYVQEGAL